LCEARYIALEEHTGFLVPDIDCDKEVFRISSPFPMISIVLCTRRPSFISNVIENLSQQSFKNFEILILVSKEFTEGDIRRFRAELQDKQIDHVIFQQKFDFPLGSGLNLLAQNAKYDLITKWDDDDFYGKNYLKNISLDYYNLGFGLAGKFPEFFHFEEVDGIISNLPHLDYFAQHPIFSGSTLTFTKKALYEISSFPDISTGEDLLWRNVMHAKGALAYCLPSFDHIVNRFKSGHSWNFDKDKFLEEAEKKYWLINESKQNISITRTEIESNN
jgi:glycosyltransferase involved in cell wall biosynthesis